MAGKLRIKVFVEKNADGNDQTVSKFMVWDSGHVIFYNQAAKSLNVTFPNGSPLCQGNTPVPSFDVDPGKEKQHKVCPGVTAQDYKYTATVKDALPEDPIIIFERKPIIIYESVALTASAALLVGLFLGYLLARRMTKVRDRPTT
jgi:hypothetical protein